MNWKRHSLFLVSAIASPDRTPPVAGGFAGIEALIQRLFVFVVQR